MDAFLNNLISDFHILIILLIIAAMFFTLGKGADMLVDEAVNLSTRWGVPKIVIGTTIVAFGTNLPEITISLFAAIGGNNELPLGNAVGSIIVNISLLIGIIAILGKVPVDKIFMKRHGTIQLLAALLLAVITLPFGFGRTHGNISQITGGVLLLLAVLYIFVSFKWAKESVSNEYKQSEENPPFIFTFVKLIAGLALIIIASNILIPAIEITAIRVGIPQSVIAATLVAFGTSVPDLVTAVTAVKKGHGELAIGSIVGDGISNILLVTGVSAVVTRNGIDVPVIFNIFYIPFMLITLILFNVLARRKKGHLARKEGILFFALYLFYILINIMIL